jgi:transcriptional regulator with XRE-family HTH domain
MNSRARQISRPSAAREASPALVVLAANIRHIREERGFSRPQLALASGIELRSLERIEHEQQEPDIDLVWRLATALHVPFSSLIAAPLDPERRAQEVSRWPSLRPARNVMSRRLWSRAEGARDSEMYELRLAPHAIQNAPRRAEGALEELLVTAGCAIVHAQGARHVLNSGDTLTLAGDLERRYANPGASQATLYVLVTLPSATN